ncbi:MAG: bifunctional adenosylcobinamide kinase/adenosylcobinamide-phosphate guanylyltransferase [Acidimicrobiales bacterium]|nr:bifunctional adenosylcobinamide kinase/adenosylcobinamide-phosphate guanylyltransferase [Acidimicrobiales bacterium]
MIVLLLGGACSGKSLVAEQLAAALPPPVTYLATAVVDEADADHAERVAAHRHRRDPAWTTIEVGGDLAAALATTAGSALVESLGTWVTARWAEEPVDLSPSVAELCAALQTRAGDTVVVSEEVGLGVHPSSEAGRRFREALGAVNLAVAAVADDVHLVVAGRLLLLQRPEVDP